MTAETQKLFLEVANNQGIDAQPYDGEYSGRGMMGAKTLAVVIEGKESHAHWIAGIVAGQNPGSPVKVRTDSLGRDVVVY